MRPMEIIGWPSKVVEARGNIYYSHRGSICIWIITLENYRTNRLA